MSLLSFFATSSTTSLLLFNLVNGAVQPQRIGEVKVAKTMLVKYLNFVKSTNWKEFFISFSFFTQTPAESDQFQKSNPLLKKHSLKIAELEFIIMGRKALRLTTNLRNRNLLYCNCVVVSLSTAGVQQGWPTYNLIVSYETKF